MKTKSIFLILIVLSFLSACTQANLVTNPTPGSGSTTPTDVVSPPGPTNQPTPLPPTPTHIPVDITPAQKAAIEAVSTKYNIPISQIKIVSTEAKTWPSGCLGVVIPGFLCTNMVVEGFSIKLEASGRQFEIHTNQDGSSVVDAAQQLGTLGLVVYTTDRNIQVVSPNIALGSTYDPAFNGFLPAGGAIAGTAYVLDFANQAKVVAVNSDSQHDLNFIQNPNYGLAIWKGGSGSQPMLAWGTQPANGATTSSLQIAQSDGSNLETLLTVDSGSDLPIQLGAQYWSEDGQSLYFSKEPVGLGGYILFVGASNLYKIDIASKQVTETIPQTPSTGPQACLDAISGDHRFVADHCAQNVLTIRDLQSGKSTTIQAPQDVIGYRLVGSARFSPSGDRVAFALAQGDPNNERGWVVVADRTSGQANLLAVSDVGNYYTVQGWFNDQTLLIQSNSIVCNPNCGSQLFTVGADGSNLTKVADGSLLAIIDNR